MTALNEKLHRIKTLKDTERSLFFSAIMIALNNISIKEELKKQINIFEEKKNNLTQENIADTQIIEQRKVEIENKCVFDLSNSIIDIIDNLIKSKIQGNNSKQRWQDQFSFIRNLNIKLYYMTIKI